MKTLYKDVRSPTLSKPRPPILPSGGATRCRRGYTTLELAVTISIVSLLVSLATPSFVVHLQKARMTSVIHRLFHDMYLARSIAITRRMPITVCKSDDGTACKTTGDWNQGWVVFEDPDADRVIDHPTDIIGVNQDGEDSISIRYSGFGAKNAIVYLPSGRSKSQNGTFTFCDGRGATHASALILHQSGRVRIAKTRANGNALSCS